MRLTQNMRSAIVRRVVKQNEEKFNVGYMKEYILQCEEMVKKLTKDVPQKQFPDYIRLDNRVTVKFSKAQIAKYKVLPSAHYIRLDNLYPSPYTVDIRIKGTPKLCKLLVAQYKNDQDRRKLENDLHELVFSVSSTEELYKILPEAEKFVDKELVNRLRKKLK